MAVTAADIARVKGMGFLKNRTNEGFSMRVITENGVLNAKQIQNLAEVAQKYGNGELAFTGRMTVEIPAIKYEDIEEVQAYIAKEGMESGGTGAKIRPVVACKGTVCKFGNFDTQALAKKVHERFYEGYSDLKLPHKFKIAVGGCPNNCVKPDLNDFGISGVSILKYDADKCKGCTKCFKECPMGAITMVDKKAVIDSTKCNNCGRCAVACPFGVIDGSEKKYVLYMGGRWGKEIRLGTKVDGFYTEEEALQILDNTIHYYEQNGNPHERLASMLDRIGTEECIKNIVK